MLAQNPLTLVVSIDGVAPRHISSSTMPSLLALAAAGGSCFDARTIRPSLTLPAHASMIRGVDVDEHGVLNNTPCELNTTAPTFLKQARLNGLRTARFTNWSPFECLFESDAADEVYTFDGGYDIADDQRITDAATSLMTQRHHQLVFVYLSQCDLTGHEYGWDSPQYVSSLSAVDNLLGELVSVLHEQDSILVTTDHGGLDKHHELSRPEDMQTFVVSKSPKVAKNQHWPSASILQVPPTVAALAGFEPSDDWAARSLV